MSIFVLPPRGSIQDDLLRTRSGLLYVATEDTSSNSLQKETLREMKILNAQLMLVTGTKITDQDLKE